MQIAQRKDCSIIWDMVSAHGASNQGSLLHVMTHLLAFTHAMSK